MEHNEEQIWQHRRFLNKLRDNYLDTTKKNILNVFKKCDNEGIILYGEIENKNNRKQMVCWFNGIKVTISPYIFGMDKIDFTDPFELLMATETIQQAKFITSLERLTQLVNEKSENSKANFNKLYSEAERFFINNVTQNGSTVQPKKHKKTL